MLLILGSFRQLFDFSLNSNTYNLNLPKFNEQQTKLVHPLRLPHKPLKTPKPCPLILQDLDFRWLGDSGQL